MQESSSDSGIRSSLAQPDGINLVETLLKNPKLAKQRSKCLDSLLKSEARLKGNTGARVILLGAGNSGKTYFYLI